MNEFWGRYSFFPNGKIDHLKEDSLTMLAKNKMLTKEQIMNSNPLEYNLGCEKERERLFFWIAILFARIEKESIMDLKYIPLWMRSLKEKLESKLHRSCCLSYTCLIFLNWTQEKDQVFFTFTDDPSERKFYETCLIFEKTADSTIKTVIQYVESINNNNFHKVKKKDLEEILHLIDNGFKQVRNKLTLAFSTKKEILLMQEGWKKWGSYLTHHCKQTDQKSLSICGQSPAILFFHLLFQFDSIQSSYPLKVKDLFPITYYEIFEYFLNPLNLWRATLLNYHIQPDPFLQTLTDIQFSHYQFFYFCFDSHQIDYLDSKIQCTQNQSIHQNHVLQKSNSSFSWLLYFICFINFVFSIYLFNKL